MVRRGSTLFLLVAMILVIALLGTALAGCGGKKKTAEQGKLPSGPGQGMAPGPSMAPGAGGQGAGMGGMKGPSPSMAPSGGGPGMGQGGGMMGPGKGMAPGQGMGPGQPQGGR